MCESSCRNACKHLVRVQLFLQAAQHVSTTCPDEGQHSMPWQPAVGCPTGNVHAQSAATLLTRHAMLKAVVPGAVATSSMLKMSCAACWCTTVTAVACGDCLTVAERAWLHLPSKGSNKATKLLDVSLNSSFLVLLLQGSRSCSIRSCCCICNCYWECSSTVAAVETGWSFNHLCCQFNMVSDSTGSVRTSTYASHSCVRKSSWFSPFTPGRVAPASDARICRCISSRGMLLSPLPRVQLAC